MFPPVQTVLKLSTPMPAAVLAAAPVEVDDRVGTRVTEVPLKVAVVVVGRRQPVLLGDRRRDGEEPVPRG